MSKAVLNPLPLPLFVEENPVHEHPMLKFTRALDQLKEEHVVLRRKLREFEVIDEIIRAGKKNTDWYGTLRNLKERVEEFEVLLTRHSDWEDEALFPTVAMYVEDDANMAEVLEEDHHLAVQYLQAFKEELKKCAAPIYQPCAKRIIGLLMNAHQLLQDHLQAEEHHIYPIAEEIIEDIDYLSC